MDETAAERAEVAPLIPQIPPQVRSAASKRRLVVFIGAGASQLMGSPSWDQLAKKMLDMLAKGGSIGHGEVDQLIHLHPKVQLSIGVDICRAQGLEIPWREILQPQADRSKEVRLFEDIYSIGTPIVTTNYDDWLPDLVDGGTPGTTKTRAESVPAGGTSRDLYRTRGQVIYRQEEFTIEKLNNPGSVLLLHGSVRDPNGMVVSTRQYLEHYSSPYIKEFLERLFSNYTVLFVGYGLEEEDILHYLVQRQKPGGEAVTKGHPEAKHFRLLHTYPHQHGLLKHLRTYYSKNCNVQLIPYCIDRHGHAQLSQVMRAWAKELGSEVRAPEFLTKASLIDEVLGD